MKFITHKDDQNNAFMIFYKAYNLGVSAKSEPGFPLQSFFSYLKKGF